MNIKFYNGSTQVGSDITSVNRVGIFYDADVFYVVVDKNKAQIDKIDAESVASGESLVVAADGSDAGLEWHLTTVSHSYDKNGVAQLPISGASWRSGGTNKLDIDLVGPNAVDHVALWDFTGPSQPPYPLRVVIRRRS